LIQKTDWPFVPFFHGTVPYFDPLFRAFSALFRIFRGDQELSKGG